jgi:hypothetical protein
MKCTFAASFGHAFLAPDIVQMIGGKLGLMNLRNSLYFSLLAGNSRGEELARDSKIYQL